MRVISMLGVLWLAFGIGLGGTVPSAAAAKVSVKTEYYEISGTTGQALLDQMDRKGPTHGFTSRAIAQTRYSMKSSADWRYSKGVCRAGNVLIKLSITYVYPQPAEPISADLKERWTEFMKGIVAHEEMHGDIARQMAWAVAKTVATMQVPDGRNCPSVQRLMKRRINAVVTEYEARQVRFDDAEHDDGGTIDALVHSLAF